MNDKTAREILDAHDLDFVLIAKEGGQLSPAIEDCGAYTILGMLEKAKFDILERLAIQEMQEEIQALEEVTEVQGEGH